MPRTVVVLPVAGQVVPVAALPALRAAAQVFADATVPEKVALAAGAVAVSPSGTDWVLLTTDLSRAPEADEVIGAPQGTALLDAAAVMDRLRSPGGCPWDAEQTHASLLPYLVEECYELYQAIEDGDGAAVREELGDVLLQVLFHARVASEAESEGASERAPASEERTELGSRPSDTEFDGTSFDIDDVAADLVTKLVGRHPHVFAGSDIRARERIDTAERQEHRWEELKRAEKQRDSSVDGVPLGQPAIALAAKLISRTARAGLPADLLPGGTDTGSRLFADAARAKLAGDDPEAALRIAARRFADDVRAAERSARDAGLDPHALDADAWRAHWPAG
jgi:NTP pyrophosphatase (non-canonical NTP hydrolase)